MSPNRMPPSLKRSGDTFKKQPPDPSTAVQPHHPAIPIPIPITIPNTTLELCYFRSPLRRFPSKWKFVATVEVSEGGAVGIVCGASNCSLCPSPAALSFLFVAQDSGILHFEYICMYIQYTPPTPPGSL